MGHGATSDDIYSRGAAHTEIGYAVAPNSESCAICVVFLGSVVDAYMSIHDVLMSLNRYVILSYEENCIGSFALARDALGKAPKFDCVRFSPEVFVLGLRRR